MSFTFYSDLVAGQSDMFRRIKDHLVTEGWTVPGSSDGTTYSAAGDVITASHDGRSPTPNSLYNISAWMRLQSPIGAGGPEILIQHRTPLASDLWRIRYSSSTGFVTGSPNATTPPDAVDEVYVFGSSAANDDFFGGGVSQHMVFRLLMCIGDEDEDYAFYAIAYPAGRPDSVVFFFMDRLTDTDPNDEDPTIIGVGVVGGSISTVFCPGTSANDWTPATSVHKSYGWQFGRDAAIEAQMHAHGIGFAPALPGDPGFFRMGVVAPTAALPRIDGLWWTRYVRDVTTFPANTILRQTYPWKGKSRLFRGLAGGTNIWLRTTDTRDLIALPISQVFASTVPASCIWAVWDGTTNPLS